MQLFIRGQQQHVIDVSEETSIGAIKEHVSTLEGIQVSEVRLYANGEPLIDNTLLAASLTTQTLDLNAALLGGKVHGSSARAGKVKGQTPKVEKQEKKKKKAGRAKITGVHGKAIVVLERINCNFKQSTHSSFPIRKVQTRTKPNKSYTTRLPYGQAIVVLKDLSTLLLKKHCTSKWLRSFIPKFSKPQATSTTDSATVISNYSSALRKFKLRMASGSGSEMMRYIGGPFPLYSTSKRSGIEPVTKQTSVDVQTEPLNDDPYVGIEKHSKTSLTTPWQTNFGSRTLRKNKTESTEIQTEPDVSAKLELTDMEKPRPDRLNSKFVMSPEPDNAIAPVHRPEAEVPSAQFTASTILEPARALFPGSEVTHIEPHSIKHVAAHFCTDPCNKHFYAVKNDVTITTSTFVRTRGHFNKLPAEVQEGKYLTIRGTHQEIKLHNYGDQPCAVFICKFRSEMREFKEKYGDRKGAK